MKNAILHFIEFQRMREEKREMQRAKILMSRKCGLFTLLIIKC